MFEGMASRKKIVTWYKRLCVVFVSALIFIAFISVLSSIIFPQSTTDAVAATSKAFEGADECIGGHAMQERNIEFFKFSFAIKYYDERCANVMIAHQFLTGDETRSDPQFVILSLNVLRKASAAFDDASAQTIDILRNEAVDLTSIDGERCVWSSWSGKKDVMVSMQCPKSDTASAAPEFNPAAGESPVEP